MASKIGSKAAMGVLAACVGRSLAPAATVLVEAEGFDKLGGWMIDQQFMDQMGSPFLLAHGLGVPVKDATTAVSFPAIGEYRVWVRTRDWVPQRKAGEAPGRFRVLIDGKPLKAVFGAKGAAWHWQDGGTVAVSKEKATIALRDLTGFEGRCDAILFSSDPAFVPPHGAKALAAFRRKALGIAAEPPKAGEYDLVVVGGGTAGICAAVAAARLGLSVALIQNRPVLGGNNSSEVRVWRGGQTNLAPWPRIGDIDREFGPRAGASPGKAKEFGDDRKEKVVRAEKNVSLFLNYHAFRVVAKKGQIVSVDARHVAGSRELRFFGRWFADCTGDASIGFLAGADWEMTRTGHMGRSNMWRIVDASKPQPFPRCPWAHDLSDLKIPEPLGEWFWESGFDLDPFAKGEHIRDNNLCGMYGAWDALKNVHGKYPNHKIEWAAFIAGKRESRRLLGDVILTKEHVLGGKAFPDAAVPSTWSIDLHLPTKPFRKRFGDDAFISRALFTGFKKPYWVPYRCLYSRNVANLFMAGRCISVTHEALGTIRVMRTTGMMGEIVGMAASVCKQHDTDPRGVYDKYLADLQAIMKKGVGKLPPVVSSVGRADNRRRIAQIKPPQWLRTAGPDLARAAKMSASSRYDPSRYPPKNLTDGKIDLNSNAGRWVSAKGMPQHVVLSWPAPQTIGAARIVTGYNQGGTVGDAIRDFVFQVPRGDGWQDVPGAKASGNTKVDWHARFPAIRADRLRLLITASHVDIARIWEIELYGPTGAKSKP